MIRMQYFQLFSMNRELFDSDLDAYVEIARRHPYFTWFVLSSLGVFVDQQYPPKPLNIEDHEEALMPAFVRRLQQNAAMYRRFEEEGFVTEYPIILERGDVIEQTTSGKRVPNKLFAGDGCHRLALLLLHGRVSLPPEFYRVKSLRTYRPRDNTHILLKASPISRADYFAYLFMGLPGELPRGREELLQILHAQDPAAAAEMDRIIRTDEPLLRD